MPDDTDGDAGPYHRFWFRMKNRKIQTELCCVIGMVLSFCVHFSVFCPARRHKGVYMRP